jgi:hypothetical protein
MFHTYYLDFVPCFSALRFFSFKPQWPVSTSAYENDLQGTVFALIGLRSGKKTPFPELYFMET